MNDFDKREGVNGAGESLPKREGGSLHETYPTKSTADPEAIRAFAVGAGRLMKDDKCEDVVVLDVRGLSQLTDYIVIGTGTSDRQMRSVGDDLEELAKEHGTNTFRRDQDERTTWLILDCVDVVMHLFEPNTRAYYDLELLWGDAKKVEWERGDG